MSGENLRMKATSRSQYKPKQLFRIYREYSHRSAEHSSLLFSHSDLTALLIPLIMEQFMSTFMGMADTVMVARVGEDVLSAVSLTDSINTLVVQVFTALAAGGTILCSQYIGQRKMKDANQAARQALISIMALAIITSSLLFIFRNEVLTLSFGSVSEAVMQNAQIYFSIVIISFPFFALFEICGSLYRACGCSRYPMLVSLYANLGNIAGNAVLIFVLNMGAAGAALSTLASRVISAIVILLSLRHGRQEIILNAYRSIRPDKRMISKILYIGIPSALENGMFQFGKLAIQSSVSTLGTAAISANALDSIFETLDGVAGIGIGIGLMTVISRCIGAHEKEQAQYYVLRLSLMAEISIAVSCFTLFALGNPIISLAGLKGESASLCWQMLIIITICKPILWVPAFIPPYAFRAAGDVKYSMIVSSLSMWFCRVALTIFLIRVAGVGLVSVWIGMFTDWAIRGILYTIHFIKGKWMMYHLS
jgi:putative MATE family efflux protein